jgi:hypothetical protein
VESGGGSIGSQSKAARADHVHPVNSASVLPTGAIWINSTDWNVNGFERVYFLNGKFWATNSNGNGIYSSTDCITWTYHSYPNQCDKMAIAYGAGKFVAVNTLGGGDTSAYSADNGDSWTATTAPVYPWVDVCYGQGLFAAVAGNGSSTTQAMTSSDGINWTSRVLPSAQTWTRVVCNPAMGFLAVAEGSTAAAFSTDGLTWAARNLPFTPNDLTVNGAYFVATANPGGSSSAIFVSTDAVSGNWATVPLPKSAVWESITTDPNGQVAVIATNSLDIAITNTAYANVYNFDLRQLPMSSAWKTVAGSGSRWFVADSTSSPPKLAYSL